MFFDQAVQEALGINFDTVHVYYLVAAGSWMMMASSLGGEQSLPSGSLLEAQADASAWIAANLSRRVISNWNNSGGDESGSKAVYA